MPPQIRPNMRPIKNPTKILPPTSRTLTNPTPPNLNLKTTITHQNTTPPHNQKTITSYITTTYQISSPPARTPSTQTNTQYSSAIHPTPPPPFFTPAPPPF